MSTDLMSDKQNSGSDAAASETDQAKKVELVGFEGLKEFSDALQSGELTRYGIKKAGQDRLVLFFVIGWIALATTIFAYVFLTQDISLG
jgi:hypothetical protein